jgi:hypothetical protein
MVSWGNPGCHVWSSMPATSYRWKLGAAHWKSDRKLRCSQTPCRNAAMTPSQEWMSREQWDALVRGEGCPACLHFREMGSRRATACCLGDGREALLRASVQSTPTARSVTSVLQYRRTCWEPIISYRRRSQDMSCEGGSGSRSRFHRLINRLNSVNDCVTVTTGGPVVLTHGRWSQQGKLQ